jgi:hypothetical protein
VLAGIMDRRPLAGRAGLLAGRAGLLAGLAVSTPCLNLTEHARHGRDQAGICKTGNLKDVLDRAEQ